MKRILAAFFCLLPPLLFAGCTTSTGTMPYVCSRIAFYARDDAVFACLSFSERGKPSSPLSFSAETPETLLQKLLNTGNNILYKPVETILLENSLSESQKKELLSALMNRNEFQLKCRAQEVEDIQNGVLSVPALPSETLSDLYRRLFNPKGAHHVTQS